jgi:hypothetical protein
MNRESAELRWGVERRLEFIEFRLLWEGGVNRGDITGRFGVSVPQASKDLALYLGLAPENMVYDRSVKRYFAGKGFEPRFLKPDADRYLSQLRMMGEGALDSDESWALQPPPFETLPMPQRHVEPETLVAVNDAIRAGKALEIHYQSLSPNRPDATWRWISPHALAFDGNRWHVRAFCHIDRSFKDFLLPRILKTRATTTTGTTAADDAIWHEITTLSLKPHPGLTDAQKKVIAQDFGMKAGRLDIKVKLALLYYLLRRLNLDDFKAEQRPARKQHVVIANTDDIRPALKRAQAGLEAATANDTLQARVSPKRISN